MPNTAGMSTELQDNDELSTDNGTHDRCPPTRQNKKADMDHTNAGIYPERMFADKANDHQTRGR